MLGKTERTTIKRVPKNARTDPATAHAILDEGLLCHVGFADQGQAFVIPMAYARDGDSVLIHGSTASRMVRLLTAGTPVCFTVTLIDGLVLARSHFHHSMNYRSLVALGTVTPVTDPDEKQRAFDRLVEHLVPGRLNEARPPSEQEFESTAVLRLPLTEASVKVRSGPPADCEEDKTLPYWGGVIPLALTPSSPIPDEINTALTPSYATRYVRPGSTRTD